MVVICHRNTPLSKVREGLDGYIYTNNPHRESQASWEMLSFSTSVFTRMETVKLNIHQELRLHLFTTE
jgi:hypothetical protein